MNRDALVPWSDGSSWEEMRLSLLTAVGSIDPQSAPVRNLVRQVAEGYAAIDVILQTLCRHTCVTCLDVCCSRATVWYDFQDLLFSCYHAGKVPERQVQKMIDGNCMHLGVNGCRLARMERPFICSWYICPEQKSLLKTGAAERGELLLAEIARMKMDRKEMENQFMRQLSLSLGCGC